MTSLSSSPEVVCPTRSLASLDADLALPDLVASFVPTPRFADVTFDNYYPTYGVPSQQAARDRVRQFVEAQQPSRLGALASLFAGRRGAREPRGLYLDGGFGVGKTHLLAAAYHAATVPKVYLSFAELAYTMIQMGLAPSIAEFRKYDLICLDEFELDDIASTRLAATFLQQVVGGPDGARVITTSNTPPRESGRGRFSAAEFQREIGQIAAQFEVVRIEGEDYRRRGRSDEPTRPLSTDELRARFAAFCSPHGAKVMASHRELLDWLSGIHPIRYARALKPVAGLFVEGLAPIRDQDEALRFVHLIDKVYDLRLAFLASGTIPLAEVFAPDYRDKGYAKKYGRCLSRLREMMEESGGTG